MTSQEEYEYLGTLRTLEDIAIEKAHKYAEHTLSKQCYAEWKQTYKDGFLAGVAYQFTGDSND
jgi:hypothetical protein